MSLKKGDNAKVIRKKTVELPIIFDTVLLLPS